MKHSFNSVSGILSFKKYIPLLFALIIWFALITSGKNISFDNHFYDWLETFYTVPISKDIVIISIDADALKKNGGWPWPRKYHAKLLDQLHSARAVGFDIIFSEPQINDAESDLALSKAIKNNRKVVLPVFPEIINKRLVETLPMEKFSKYASGLGHVDTARDGDGIIRRTFLSAGLGSAHWRSFAEATLDTARGHPLGTKKHPVDDTANTWVRDQEFLVPFPKNEYAFRVLPYEEVLNGQHQEQIRNSIVLVGVTAVGLGDSHVVANSSGGYNMPGVAIVASILNAIQNNKLIRITSDWHLLFIGFFLLLSIDLIAQRVKLYDDSGIHYYVYASVVTLLVSIGLFFGMSYWMPTLSLVLLLLILGLVRLLMQQTYFRILALTDGLTSLANRRHFDERLIYSLQQSKRLETPLSLMIIDIDFFKSYNDHYGHRAGDEVLKRLGGILKSMQRNSRDIAARIGGEEFAILLPNTDTKNTEKLAEKLRIAVQSLSIEHIDNPYKVVTCSIGTITTTPEQSILPSELYESADIALYYSKRNGRNQVNVYSTQLHSVVNSNINILKIQ